jgi:hypothetical protein
MTDLKVNAWTFGIRASLGKVFPSTFNLLGSNSPPLAAQSLLFSRIDTPLLAAG